MKNKSVFYSGIMALICVLFFSPISVIIARVSSWIISWILMIMIYLLFVFVYMQAKKSNAKLIMPIIVVGIVAGVGISFLSGYL